MSNFMCSMGCGNDVEYAACPTCEKAADDEVQRSTPLRALPPIVVELSGGVYAWIGGGHGFLLSTRGAGTWVPMTDYPAFGGHVLPPSRVAALVATFGRPVPS